jgi:hypothetical protein
LLVVLAVAVATQRVLAPQVAILFSVALGAVVRHLAQTLLQVSVTAYSEGMVVVEETPLTNPKAVLLLRVGAVAQTLVQTLALVAVAKRVFT